MPGAVACRAFADPAAIDVEAELDAALHERDKGIDGAELDHEAEVAVLHQVVDDAPLQLERHHLEEEGRDRQRHEAELMQG